MRRKLYYAMSLLFFVLFGNEIVRYNIQNIMWLMAFMFFTVMARMEEIGK